LENRKSEDDKMFGRIWKAVKTRTEEVWVEETRAR